MEGKNAPLKEANPERKLLKLLLNMTNLTLQLKGTDITIQRHNRFKLKYVTRSKQGVTDQPHATHRIIKDLQFQIATLLRPNINSPAILDALVLALLH